MFLFLAVQQQEKCERYLHHGALRHTGLHLVKHKKCWYSQSLSRKILSKHAALPVAPSGASCCCCYYYYYYYYYYYSYYMLVLLLLLLLLRLLLQLLLLSFLFYYRWSEAEAALLLLISRFLLVFFSSLSCLLPILQPVFLVVPVVLVVPFTTGSGRLPCHC